MLAYQLSGLLLVSLVFATCMNKYDGNTIAKLPCTALIRTTCIFFFHSIPLDFHLSPSFHFPLYIFFWISMEVFTFPCVGPPRFVSDSLNFSWPIRAPFSCKCFRSDFMKRFSFETVCRLSPVNKFRQHVSLDFKFRPIIHSSTSKFSTEISLRFTFLHVGYSMRLN